MQLSNFTCGACPLWSACAAQTPTQFQPVNQRVWTFSEDLQVSQPPPHSLIRLCPSHRLVDRKSVQKKAKLEARHKMDSHFQVQLARPLESTHNLSWNDGDLYETHSRNSFFKASASDCKKQIRKVTEPRKTNIVWHSKHRLEREILVAWHHPSNKAKKVKIEPANGAVEVSVSRSLQANLLVKEQQSESASPNRDFEFRKNCSQPLHHSRLVRTFAIVRNQYVK